jgi:hypothetical protein
VPLAVKLERLAPLDCVSASGHHLTGYCYATALTADAVEPLATNPKQLASLHCEDFLHDGLEGSTSCRNCCEEVLDTGKNPLRNSNTARKTNFHWGFAATLTNCKAVFWTMKKAA